MFPSADKVCYGVGMKKLGILVALATLMGCAAPAATDPEIDFQQEYMAIACIYNMAVDTWDTGDRSDLEFMLTFAQRMADATRKVEERLLAIEWPEDVQEAVDELLEAEAKAHVAFLVMAASKDLGGAEAELANAFKIYSGATEYSEMIRARLGLPSVEVSPHHYL